MSLFAVCRWCGRFCVPTSKGDCPHCGAPVKEEER